MPPELPSRAVDARPRRGITSLPMRWSTLVAIWAARRRLLRRAAPGRPGDGVCASVARVARGVAAESRIRRLRRHTSAGLLQVWRLSHAYDDSAATPREWGRAAPQRRTGGWGGGTPRCARRWWEMAPGNGVGIGETAPRRSEGAPGDAFATHAHEWTRTTTTFRPPTPQAGASTNSATCARNWEKYSVRGDRVP
ncbi:MAG: hypothetical protein JWM90_1265 [Thermoleophilia bacterium]|nr:hypothetical protein [Thermoleophilia bacterium]